MKFAFVHIPKTAGTTIVDSLKGKYKVWHVDSNQIPSGNYDICFGHFYPSVYENYPLVTWIREPVNRMISHFTHLKLRQKRNRNRIAVFPDGTTEFDPDIDIISFAEYVGNIESHYISGWILKFDFIGIVEQMEGSWKDFKDKFELDLSDLPKKKIRETNHVFVSRFQKRELKKLLKEDRELYEMICSRVIT